MNGNKRPVIWSPEARADLSDIWTYYADNTGRHTADDIIRSIGAALNVINDHPYAGRSRNEVRTGLRSIPARPHVIFYRVGTSDTSEIVRILDERRDLDPLFQSPSMR
jgi:plasmid stabilization system protein ParE